MTGCTCEIDGWHDDMPEFVHDKILTARRTHQCCECREDIRKGQEYEKTTGKWDGRMETYKTCLDCVSIRKALFCSWVYEQMWEELQERFLDDPQPPSAACMMSLTPKARDAICDLIEENWDDQTTQYEKEE